MKLPKINSRAMIVRRASVDFMELCVKADEEHALNKLNMAQVVESYSRVISNITTESHHVHNNLQQAILDALKTVHRKYRLTIGEQLLLINEACQRAITFIIRWERENKVMPWNEL